jgi:hypothetical protein
LVQKGGVNVQACLKPLNSKKFSTKRQSRQVREKLCMVHIHRFGALLTVWYKTPLGVPDKRNEYKILSNYQPSNFRLKPFFFSTDLTHFTLSLGWFWSPRQARSVLARRGHPWFRPTQSLRDLRFFYGTQRSGKGPPSRT